MKLTIKISWVEINIHLCKTMLKCYKTEILFIKGWTFNREIRKNRLFLQSDS